jgi:hypothetical protein
MVGDARLHEFMGQMLSDLGGAASVALVRIGDALGLYKTLHERGPMTVAEFAAAAGVNQRYLREWLSHQAASNYLSYDPATQKFTLPPEQDSGRSPDRSGSVRRVSQDTLPDGPAGHRVGREAVIRASCGHADDELTSTHRAAPSPL